MFFPEIHVPLKLFKLYELNGDQFDTNNYASKKKTHLPKHVGMAKLQSLAKENNEKYPIFSHIISHTSLLKKF